MSVPEFIVPTSVTVILLNYCGSDDTIACLQALYTIPDKPGRVIIVDNASHDDSVINIKAFLKQTPLPTVLIELSENKGYATGNNAGIHLALHDPECQAIWILNNDTVPQADALRTLCSRLNACPNAGMAGSTMVFFHNTKVVQCAGGYGFNPYWGTTPAIQGKATTQEVLNLAPALIESSLQYLSGASILVRCDVFKTIGCFAEEYFLYYEDTEFGLRSRRAGYSLAWASDSVVLHKEGASTGAQSAVKDLCFHRPKMVDYLSLRNRIYLLHKYFPIYLPVAILSYAAVCINRIHRGQIRRLPLVLKALVDGLSGRMGKPTPSLMPNKKIKVLFLTSRADFGGGPEHLWQLLRHLSQNAEVFIACPPDYPYYARYCSVVGQKNIFLLPHRKFNFSKIWKLKDFCRKNGVTLLHSHGKGAGLYSRLLVFLTGLPCVHTFHGIHMGEYGMIRKMFYRIYERFASYLTHTAIVVSKEERETVIRKLFISEKKLCLVENGVVIPKSNTPFASFSPFNVISISRFDYQKNSIFLLDIFKALKKAGRLADFHFIVVGDGPERNKLVNAARSAGFETNLNCVGATENPSIYFTSALCYISTSRWEGMPLAVLEAMAHGVPVVATNVVGNKDVVKNGQNGFLYSEKDEDAAAAALIKLAKNIHLRNYLGAEAQKYTTKYHSVLTMVDRTMNVLRDANIANDN